MHLHCLGTAGYHPNETRHTSCYFLPDAGIVLDAGTGLFRLPPLVQTDTLDILLSHAHLDHVVGLTYLLDVLYEIEHVHGRKVRRLRIWGESAKLDAVQKHLFSELIFPVALDATWHPIDDAATFRIGDVDIAWNRQTHPGGSVAYRLEGRDGDGRPYRLVYATDTTGGIDDASIAFAASADWLVHECNFGNAGHRWAEKTGHAWVDRVAEIARRTGAKNVLLTHINPLADLDPAEVAAAFEVPVTIAQDTETIRVPGSGKRSRPFP